MLANEIKAVLFDSDGTLVDSEPISLRVLVDLVAEQGLEIPHDEAVRQWSGADLAEVFQQIAKRLGRDLPEDFLDAFRTEQLARLASEVKPIGGAAELLSSIAKPVCVASNAPTNKVQLCLRTTKLEQYFDTCQIFSAYDVQAWKPRPDLFLHAAEKMGVPPENCAVVEDSSFGIDAGLAANMTVFAYDPKDEHADRANVVCVKHLSQLIPHLA